KSQPTEFGVKLQGSDCHTPSVPEAINTYYVTNSPVRPGGARTLTPPNDMAARALHRASPLIMPPPGGCARLRVGGAEACGSWENPQGLRGPTADIPFPLPAPLTASRGPGRGG